MLKLTFTLALNMLMTSILLSQYSTVIYNYQTDRFGENEPLPAEKPILLTGNVPEFIDVVEVALFQHRGIEEREPLVSSSWKRTYNDQGTSFSIPVNYPLQASKKYDVAIYFFRTVSDAEKEQLFNQLQNNLHSYLRQNTDVNSSKIKLLRKSQQLVNDLNSIVFQGLQNYRSKTNIPFNGFSDIVKQDIDNLDKLRLPESIKSLPDSIISQKKSELRSTLLEAIKSQISTELSYLISQDWAVLYDQRYIDDYSTEDRPTHFAINAGYGGIWLNGQLDDKSSFGDAAYLGLGFPLSTSTIAPRIFQDASITLGFFTKNFSTDEGTSYSGPIFNKPLYAGIDYKLFSFIRLNAGTAILERSIANKSGSIVILKPFIGLSAKVNISLSLDK